MKKQPSIKLTPSQLKMKAVLKPIVEGILNERPQDIPKVVLAIKNFAENETDVLAPTEQMEVFVQVAKYLQDRALSIKRSQV